MSTAQRHKVSAFSRRHARHMRVVATDAERAMWLLLRDRRLQGFKFRRQVPFQNFILDFVSYEQRLVVEIDGGQHADSGDDQIRETRLLAEGFHVVRYWNNEVLKNPEGVLLDLWARINHPSPGPPLRGGPPSPTRGEG